MTDKKKIEAFQLAAKEFVFVNQAGRADSSVWGKRFRKVTEPTTDITQEISKNGEIHTPRI